MATLSSLVETLFNKLFEKNTQALQDYIRSDPNFGKEFFNSYLKDKIIEYQPVGFGWFKRFFNWLILNVASNDYVDGSIEKIYDGIVETYSELPTPSTDNNTLIYYTKQGGIAYISNSSQWIPLPLQLEHIKGLNSQGNVENIPHNITDANTINHDSIYNIANNIANTPTTNKEAFIFTLTNESSHSYQLYFVENRIFIRSNTDDWTELATSATNIGTGEGKIFKQKTNENLELKTLKAGENVNISNNTDEVTINTTAETNTATNIGTGEGKIFKQKTDENLELKTLKAGDKVTITNDANEITINTTATEGETNTASNVGSGEGKIFKQKTDETLELKTLKAGDKVTITNDANEITINTTATEGEINTATNVGSGEGKIFKQKTNENLELKTLKAGGNVTITNDANEIIINTMGGTAPTGLIAMWSGAVANIPDDWTLCDGTNNTPDLRGRFIAGYNPNNTDYNSIGKTGGSDTHTLTTDEMPSHTHAGSTSTGGYHNHSINNVGTGDGNVTSIIRAGSNVTGGISTSHHSGHTHGLSIGANGSSHPHENRPSYYTLAYIMKQ